MTNLYAYFLPPVCVRAVCLYGASGSYQNWSKTRLQHGGTALRDIACFHGRSMHIVFICILNAYLTPVNILRFSLFIQYYISVSFYHGPTLRGIRYNTGVLRHDLTQIATKALSLGLYREVILFCKYKALTIILIVLQSSNCPTHHFTTIQYIEMNKHRHNVLDFQFVRHETR